MGEKRKRIERSDSDSNSGSGSVAGFPVETSFVLRGVEESPDKKVKVGSEEPVTPKPLTRKNLALLEGKMPAVTRSAKQTEAESGKSEHTGEPSVSLSTTTNSKTTKDHAYVNEQLALNGMLLDDATGLNSNRGKKIMERASTMITSTRLSPKNQKVWDQWAPAAKECAFSDEATFIDNMWWIILRKKRSVKENLGTKEERIISQAWALDHLRHNRTHQFTRGYLPNLDVEAEKILGILLQKGEGMTNPVPDLTYGLSESAFDSKEIQAFKFHTDLTQLSRPWYFAWFIAEFKSYKGVMADARNQANRGGAVIVNTMNMFKERAGVVDEDDEHDDGSYVFSMTMTPDNAELYVHWREARHEGTKVKILHHMNYLGNYHLRDNQQRENLRVAIYNILDWGVGTRKTYLKGLANKIRLNVEATGSEEASQSDKKGKGKATSSGGSGSKK